MAVNRRLVIWLLRAYIKKWGKIIILYFFLGLIIFFLFILTITYILPKLPIAKKEAIGLVGSYTLDNIPENILSKISEGLTSVDGNGKVMPGLASSWDIKDNGKTYIFHINNHLRFSDGSSVNSKSITISFSDVNIQRPDNNTIIFKLKEPYAPFLLSVSHPLFKNNFIGVGEYKLQDIKLNAGYVQSLILASVKNTSSIRTYQFYPTEDALKIAFAFGEVSQIQGLNDLSFRNSSFARFPNAHTQKVTDYSLLVTIFYNIQDKSLSDKKLRDALVYALPDSFSEGDRAHSSISPQSWAYQEDTLHVQDLTHAKLLLESAGYGDKNKAPALTISALSKYKKTANDVAKAWQSLGIKTTILMVDTLPSGFQIYLGDFHVSKDPDQYSLWHSDQRNNIMGYKNLRIDKLLEDGRKTIDQDKRVQIYADFQKYLMDDQPASFLYFPYSYTVKRK